MMDSDGTPSLSDSTADLAAVRTTGMDRLKAALATGDINLTVGVLLGEGIPVIDTSIAWLLCGCMQYLENIQGHSQVVDSVISLPTSAIAYHMHVRYLVERMGFRIRQEPQPNSTLQPPLPKEAKIEDADRSLSFPCSEQPLVSLCMIAKNEEEYIERCLHSVRSVADEIIVVDTGSQDRTPLIAKACGATVVFQNWANDFSLHRNHAISQARGQWILVLDADEELQLHRPSEFRQYLTGVVEDAVFFLVISPTESGLECTPQPRLFRRLPSLRYVNAVHECLTLPTQAKRLFTDIQIVHHGYQKKHIVQKKLSRNLALLRQLPESYHRLLYEARHCHSLGDFESARSALFRIRELNYNETPELALQFCLSALHFCREEAEPTLRAAFLAHKESIDICFLAIVLHARRLLITLLTEPLDLSTWGLSTSAVISSLAAFLKDISHCSKDSLMRGVQEATGSTLSCARSG